MTQNRIAELSMHMPRMSPVIQLHCSVKNAVGLFFFFSFPFANLFFICGRNRQKHTSRYISAHMQLLLC